MQASEGRGDGGRGPTPHPWPAWSVVVRRGRSTPRPTPIACATRPQHSTTSRGRPVESSGERLRETERGVVENLANPRWESCSPAVRSRLVPCRLRPARTGVRHGKPTQGRIGSTGPGREKDAPSPGEKASLHASNRDYYHNYLYLYKGIGGWAKGQAGPCGRAQSGRTRHT